MDCLKYQQEAERCLHCKVAMCQKKCPVGTPIPQITTLIKEGKYDEAAEILFENNPLSAITSVVCPHERNCYGNCVLGRKSEPISFYELEKELSRNYLENFVPNPVEKKGKRVAVVGSGPSGITMAIRLLQNGYDVTMFEAFENMGGVLTYGIPDFRLPKDYIALYKKMLFDMGMKFRPNTRIGTNITIEDLMMDGYKAVFMATGTGKPNKLGLLGETLGHVHFAVDYLKYPDSTRIGKKVVVIGSGNVAMDAARTAILHAGSEVKILNYMADEDISASREEVKAALDEGAEIISLVQAIRITDDYVRCVKVIKSVDEEGNALFEEDYSETFDLEADSVIIAIGQGPGFDIKSGYDVKLDRRGMMLVNEKGETSQPGVYAAGDIVSGPKTVVEAVAFTIKVADAIMEFLENEGK